MAEFFGQTSLVFVVVEVGKVDRSSGLLADNFDHPGMGVAQQGRAGPCLSSCREALRLELSDPQRETLEGLKAMAEKFAESES